MEDSAVVEHIEFLGKLFDGEWWSCPRCTWCYLVADEPGLLAKKVDDHLLKHHGINLEDYQEDGFPVSGIVCSDEDGGTVGGGPDE